MTCIMLLLLASRELSANTFSLLSLYIYIVSCDLYMFTTRESQNLGERPTDIFFYSISVLAKKMN